jgi:hypothetical protein
MKYSYLFFILSVFWGCYTYLDSDSLNTKKPNTQRNIFKQDKNGINNFASLSIGTIFLKKRIKNLEEIHISSERKIISTKDNSYDIEMLESPRELQPLLDPYEKKSHAVVAPKVGYENEFGEGVAVTIDIDTEYVGSENKFGEGVAVSVDSFDRKVGYENEYGEGVAANIDPILEEMIANTPEIAPLQYFPINK